MTDAEYMEQLLAPCTPTAREHLERGRSAEIQAAFARVMAGTGSHADRIAFIEWELREADDSLPPNAPSPQSRFRRFGQPSTEATPLVEDLPPRDVEQAPRVYHCSNCGERGHSARSKTCGLTKEQRAEHRRNAHRGKR